MRKFWIINGLLFQLAWFAAALLTQYAALIISIILVLHFILSDKRKADTKLLALAPIGWLVDSLLVHYSVITSTNGWLPLWLLLLWCVFVISLNHSLLWLSKTKWPLLIIIGSISGCMSYTAAIRFGALDSSLELTGQVIYLGLLWGVLLPVLVVLSNLIANYKANTNKPRGGE
ncbi:DUF2878 domain-containing protein [Paraglaciecola sp. 2405UD69-4]|uniref:DUF2878 domain-containing protein n=1 Tax=Paraglaciecola sp. 2405UD69-4 TaxID=3391836 RepID=UPI0039C8D076